MEPAPRRLELPTELGGRRRLGGSGVYPACGSKRAGMRGRLCYRRACPSPTVSPWALHDPGVHRTHNQSANAGAAAPSRGTRYAGNAESTVTVRLHVPCGGADSRRKGQRTDID